jgi:hypothetical protein
MNTVNERVRSPLIDLKNKEARKQLLSLPEAEKLLTMLGMLRHLALFLLLALLY